ncbi:tetratricopeptide repeat protein [uncultured Algibacter sp.]|uniref:tetratricopeptide repeat protein n=1 Tax=uncultured Algibacter sp. TaxID=298659 RepID=UPI00260D4B71|nr:tetratricopeptide repeat protein [uncultured Algibacter sp.]
MIAEKSSLFPRNYKHDNTTKYFYLVIFFAVFFSDISNAQNKISDYTKAKKVFDKGMELRFKSPDSSLILFQKSHDLYMKNQDTVSAVLSLIEKSLVYENNAQYASSYEVLWNALQLTDNTSHKTIKSVVYNKLGRTYSYYKREDEALDYLKKSLEIHKNLAKNHQINPAGIVPYYYAIVSTYRDLEKPELAKTYLDSSYLYFSKSNEVVPRAYLDFENANILCLQNKNEEALEIMEKIFPWFQQNQPSYLVLFYKYWGDIYLNLSKLKQSEALYLKALKISKEYKSHIDFTPLIYEKLTKLYLLKNDFKNAFLSLKTAKELDAKFFDSRSTYNQPLIEIKDSYRQRKEQQQKLIQAQQLKQLEQEDKIKILQRRILLVSVVFILIIGYFYIRNLRARHKTEKELIKRNKELEIKKARELLELKNKELASSALQLIEKDEFLKNLKTKIRDSQTSIKKSELNKILKSVSVNNTNSWDEFKLRFIEVNKDFYDKIFEKFPNLSQGDQKICALIKLNMSSKEMSRLLGISVESVHTSRHRIRKKMKLPREINLEDYINSL